MVIADMRVVDPLLRIIANDFGTTVGNTAAIISAYTIPYGLFQLIYGPLGDRIGKLKVMTVGISIFAIGTALCAFVPNLPLLILLRFLTGMFAAAVIPLSIAYIGDNFPYAERQTAIGRYLSALMLGQILSSSLGGIFGQFISWREIFLLFGVTSMLVAIIFWQATRHIPHQSRTQTGNISSSLKPYLQLMTKPAARLVITAVFIEGFFLYGGFAYIGAFIRDNYHLPYITIGILLSGLGMGGLLYSISVKRLVQQLGEKGLVMVGGLLVGSCYLSITILPSWILFIPGIILLGLGLNMMHSTLQTQATELSPESRGTAVSLFAFNLFLGQGIGAVVLGRIVDNTGYKTCFIVCGIAVAVLAVWFANQMRYLKQT
ncbi:MFS transporter [Anabaena lutea FACHB-196]|uniref:MFS transporter n=2 Tax=Anabaena TaxID=1163 RepID=A0ABR8FKA4_9NOST|nr:MFS transporter [Anabaena lutea]MBD2570107.1 MFS transporter [Anabaena lutea FACHB-196]